MVRHGPVTFGIERANEASVSVFLEDHVPIDVRLAGLHVDVGNKPQRRVDED